MADVLTLTMNPAVDGSAETERVVPEHKLRCSAPNLEPGGGGLNVTRAIHLLGGGARALYTAGGATGQLLRGLLAAAGIDHFPISISGRTRENLTISESRSNTQYRFVMPGPALSRAEWEKCLQLLASMKPAPRFVVASGSLPAGVPVEFYREVAQVAGDLGARLVLDTSDEALRRGVERGVYLLKPNLRELGQLFGEDLTDESAQERAAKSLADSGKAEVVVLSLGAAGALLVTRSFSERIRAPTVPIRSKIGAGDCTVAGMVLGLALGDELRHAVRRGVAAGAAAVMSPGTELCRREDTERLYARLLADL